MRSIFDTNLGQAWLVMLLAIIFGSSLAGVQAALGPRIEENKLKETLEKVPVVILGQMAADELQAKDQPLIITPNTVSVDKGGVVKFYTLYRADFVDGTTAGWVVKTSGQGYADRIELLLGMDQDAENVTGLFILDQKETPGLGNKIVEDEWRAQYSGKSTSTPFTVVKLPRGGVNEIDAISGATISSDVVTNMVNQAVSDLKPRVLELKISEPKTSEPKTSESKTSESGGAN